MDSELRTFLEGMEGRLPESTRQNIAESEMRSKEHTEEVETRLLKEFWKWAKTADARYRQHQGTVIGLDTRVQLVEDRISDLERRDQSQ